MSRAGHAAAVFAGFLLLFAWVFAGPLISGTYLAESDLFDFFLPIFLAPRTVWSSYEFAGMPVFADAENQAFYPLHAILAGGGAAAWNAFVMSAYVLGACFTYAYAYAHTRSVAAALLAGIAFSLSEAMLERVPHQTIVHSLMWLPLILLAIDGLHRDRYRWRWAAVGAVASANCLLAGHPQFAVYIAGVCAVYAFVGAVAERSGVHFLGAVTAMAATGGLLAAISLVPLVELSRWMQRQSVGFSEFGDYANSPLEMLSIFFPTVAHVGREAPTYVGLAVLMLAAVGVGQFRAGWRVGFWTVTVIVALLLGVGQETPVARLVYELPLQDNFRIVARYLVFAAFGLAVLAAFGVAAIERQKVSARALVAGVGFPLLLVAGAAALLAARADAIRYETLNEALVLPLWNSDVWIQVAVAAAAAAICVAFWRCPRSLAMAAVLLVFVSGDLLHASPYAARLTGLDWETVPSVTLEPSVHARRLADALAPAHQRLVAPSGAHANDVVPAGFARVWRIPAAGGYTSVLLDNVATIARVGMTGVINRSVLAADDMALDLLAVRYLVYPQDRLTDEDRAYLAHADRWRETDRFRTSRLTDRGADDASGDEVEHVVFENRRALPRAWLALEVVPLRDDVLRAVVRTSTLPDGRRVEPARMALVGEGVAAWRGADAGDATVTVESIHDTHAQVRVSSTGGGFLVLSEAWYPGWRARVDEGDWQPVTQVFVALQGIAVPAGQHLVRFEFVPRTRPGAVLSAVGLVALAGMAVMGTGFRRGVPDSRGDRVRT